MKSQYDHIIIGASLPGIVGAAALARTGHSVLLTNVHGFPGGSITEQLNCRQLAERDSLPSDLRTLYDEVAADSFGGDILNPETVKYALQTYLQRSGAEPLFHVTPRGLSRSGNDWKLTLTAKEGDLTVHASRVTDATESFDGAVLLGMKRSVTGRCLRLFTSVPVYGSFLSFERIQTAVRLDDGRYWLSLRIESVDELFAEQEAHELQDELRIRLERSGARIQMLPLGICTQYALSNAGVMETGFEALFARSRNGKQLGHHFAIAAESLIS